MGTIVHLDRNTVNMIAAGEVVERPASVVKELLENSIDAGATEVTTGISDGGRKLITVTDNGAGMDAEDLASAFDAHATSKLSDASQLEEIGTLGFRGEALASIASVAQVRAVSRRRESDQANMIEIDCGRRSPVTPCSGDIGTTIQVRDLFYRIPARRKFVRTANTEMGHISEQFTRIALAHPQLHLTLFHNDRQVHCLSANQPLRQRITQLFPMLPAEELIETETEEKNIRIRALLGRPTLSRSNSQLQYAFLNGRFIRDRFISHAFKEAYRGLLEPNRFGVVFLFLEMPFDAYDVNVHPTKIEVRFYNGNLVHSQVLGALREKLLGTDLSVPAALNARRAAVKVDADTVQQARRQEIAEAMAAFFQKHRPSHRQRQFDLRPDFPAGKPAHRTEAPASSPASLPEETGGSRYLQIHDSYIVEQTADGFVIIDQHALHERMLYEAMRQRVRRTGLEAQRLLLPETVELNETQANLLNTHGDVVAKLGIEVAPFGPRTYAVQAFPTMLGKLPPAEFLQDLMDLLAEKTGVLGPEDLLDEVLNMAACKAAIKAGQKLSDDEIEQLLADREAFESTSRCPHGRPTTIKFSIRELEKQFKRS
jgi:DNA mismatch repair protein MutL